MGIRGGIEAIIHTVREVLQDGDDNMGILQVDLINAYNMADRDSAFKEVEENFPDIIKWVLTSYGSEAELVFGKYVILSRLGFHQGDPIAGLLFSLVLQPIINRILTELPSLKLHAWYLEDGTQVGTREELQRVVDIIKEEGPRRGLHLSTSATVHPPSLPKSTVWFPHQVVGDDPLDRGVPSIKESGVELLGTPVGDQAFTEETIMKRFQKIQTITDTLPMLQDAHTEFALLRSCLSMPKIMYSLRTTDPTPLQDLWQEYDCMTREALQRIMGIQLNSTQWSQAQLPVTLGGLGLKAAVDHAGAAYASSKLSSQDLKEKILHTTEQDSPSTLPAPFLALLSAKQGEEATKENLTGVPQKAISLKIDLIKHNLLTQHFTNTGVKRDMARLTCLALPHAGDWINVVPSPSLGLHLRSPEWIISAKYRLGCPVFTAEGLCPACQHQSDREGDHAISCGSEGERIARHNQLRDHLFNTCVCAALGPVKEERALIPGSDARPADVLIPNWISGKDTALDVTVVNPLQTQMLDQAATHPHYACDYRYGEKMTKHGEPCRLAGMVFVPLVVETLGGWEEQGEKQIKRIEEDLARQTGQDEGSVLCVASK